MPFDPVPFDAIEAIDKADLDPTAIYQPALVVAAHAVDVAQTNQILFAGREFVPGHLVARNLCLPPGEPDPNLTELVMRSPEGSLSLPNPLGNSFASAYLATPTGAVIGDGVFGKTGRYTVDVVLIEALAVPCQEIADSLPIEELFKTVCH
jgi:hypothetical protein